MLDTLTREINARWGLADQGRPLVQMLVATISNPATGGLSGFLEKFRKAGWGGMVNTWVGNAGNAEIPTTAQVEAVLGAAGDGFLQRAAAQLGLSYDKVITVVAGVLPRLVDQMTPDGHIPAALPPALDAYAREGQALLAAGAAPGIAAAAGADGARMAAHSAPAASSGGWGKWLPWLLGALVVIGGVSYCSKAPAPTSPPAEVGSVAPPPTPPVASAPEAPQSPASPATADTATPSAPASASASASATMPAESAGTPGNTGTSMASDNMASDHFTAPEGAGVVDGMHQGMPVLRVFFATGKAHVDPTFASQSQALVDFLKAHPDVKAVISGFNDPTGNATRNAQLSKERAQAVQAALQAQGIAADRTVLEKPADTAGTGTTHAAARRVDVMLRR